MIIVMGALTLSSAAKAGILRQSNNMNRERVQKLLEACDLYEKERQILEWRHFGNGNVQMPMTLEEVGKEFGVTRERIRQIEAKAQERIRYQLREFARALNVNLDRTYGVETS